MRTDIGYLTQMHPGGDTEVSWIPWKPCSMSQEPHFVFCQSEGARSPMVKSPSPSTESQALLSFTVCQWGRGIRKEVSPCPEEKRTPSLIGSRQLTGPPNPPAWLLLQEA